MADDYFANIQQELRLERALRAAAEAELAQFRGQGNAYPPQQQHLGYASQRTGTGVFPLASPSYSSTSAGVPARNLAKHRQLQQPVGSAAYSGTFYYGQPALAAAGAGGHLDTEPQHPTRYGAGLLGQPAPLQPRASYDIPPPQAAAVPLQPTPAAAVIERLGHAEGRLEALQRRVEALEKKVRPPPLSSAPVSPADGVKAEEALSDDKRNVRRARSMDHRGGTAAGVMIAQPTSAGRSQQPAPPAEPAPVYGALPAGRKPSSRRKPTTAAAAEGGAASTKNNNATSSASVLPPRAPNASRSSDAADGPNPSVFAATHLGQVIPVPPSAGGPSSSASHELTYPLRAVPHRAPSPSTLDASRAAEPRQRKRAADPMETENTILSHHTSRSSSWINQHTTASPAPIDPIAGPNIPRRFAVSMLTPEEEATVMHIVRRVGRLGEYAPLVSGEPLPDSITHVVVRTEPVSEKALRALITGRIVVTLEYMHQSAALGMWVDENQVNTAYLCSPAWPLEHQRFIITIEDADMHSRVRELLRAGGAVVLDKKTGGGGSATKAFVISTPEDLTSHIRQFYH